MLPQILTVVRREPVHGLAPATFVLTQVSATLWTAYGVADVNAWTTVETLRLLVGQNVPYDFVRLASGRGLF